MDYIIEQPSKKNAQTNNNDVQFIIEPPKKKQKTAEQIGRELPSPLQGGVNAVSEGLLFGLGDEAYGALDRKSTRLNSSHSQQSRMPSSA